MGRQLRVNMYSADGTGKHVFNNMEASGLQEMKVSKQKT